MEYRFRFKENGSIVKVNEWDVKEMVKNAHDWECLDDVSRVMLGDAADVILPAMKRDTLTLNKAK